MTTGLLYDPIFLQHQTSPGHPECSQRLTVSLKYLENQSWFASLTKINACPADVSWIETIHSRSYIRRAEETCRAGVPYLDSLDVSISTDSYDAAINAAGGTLALADLLMKREITNGFALLRPPGHHAEHEMALGFCLFNNVAILARYLQQQYGLGKVMILDWDVHHGNGTQHSFEDDPSVLYISTHQYPFYPGTGAWSETGIGRGTGATLNCPMPANSNDRDYEIAFKEKIIPKIDEFKPEFIIISAGFDAHRDDPLANIELSTGFYGWMTRLLVEKAEHYSEGRILSLLEGGYNLERLPQCISEHLGELTSA